jgi:hypothetical protein
LSATSRARPMKSRRPALARETPAPQKKTTRPSSLAISNLSGKFGPFAANRINAPKKVMRPNRSAPLKPDSIESIGLANVQSTFAHRAGSILTRYGWLEVKCKRCETSASIPLDAVRRPRDTPIWKLEAALKCRSCGTHRYKPPVHMIKLTQQREITPYKWVHPDDDR